MLDEGWTTRSSRCQCPGGAGRRVQPVSNTPHKEIVWFKHSGHTPWVSEPDRFVQMVVQTVLAQTQP